MFASLLRQALGIALLSLLLLACHSPEQISFSSAGYNERLRPDREPLTNDQAATDPAELRYGPYRVGPGVLTPALVPALNGPVQNLPQSDCWWLAQAPLGGGDAMRAHWEAVGELAQEGDLESFEDPDDGRLELGACRLNDPETRRPPLSVDRVSDTHEELMIDSTGDPQQLLVASLGDGANFPRILNDQFALLEVLTARASTVASDPLNTCANRLSTFHNVRLTVTEAQDFFDGPTGEGYAPSCTRSDGFLLIPPVHTQYHLRNGTMGAEKLLEPVLLVARRNDTLGRPLSSDAGAVRWRTDSADRTLGARWTENFSPSLRVQSVRLFRLSGNQVAYLTDAPPLCIVDADSGPGCRWTCSDSDTSASVTRYDLLSGTGCVNAQGVNAIPDVNPTLSASTWRVGALRRPLEWRFGFQPSAPAHVEFTLTTSLNGMSLLAEPPGMDMGRVRPGERRPGTFTVTNLGEHAVRVTRVRIDPTWRQPGAYSVRLPFSPEPLPIGIELTQTAPRQYDVSTPPAFEQLGVVASFHGPAHWHVRPAEQPNTPILYDGIAITSRDGILYRDRADQTIKYRPPGPGTTAPIRAAVWAERTTPFLVQPGERIDLQVTAAPTSAGTKEARVEVTAESVLDPTQRQTVAVAVTAYGLVGPVPLVVPHQRYYDARSQAPSPLSFLVVNNGDMTLTVSAVAFRAENGGTISAENDRFRLVSRNFGPFNVASGASDVLTVGYEPRCGASGEIEHRASMRVLTGGGATHVVLVGRSPRC